MTNETTSSQPKSIGDDAQFMTLLNEANYTASEASVCGNDFGTGDKAQAAEDALITYIDSRAPAAQASATIQAAPEVLNTERLSLLINRLSVENRRDGWAGEKSYFGSADLERAKKAVDVAERNLLEYVKSIAAAIQEPVMVAEPVAYADPMAFVNFTAKVATKEWMWAKPDAGLVPLYRAAPMVADPAGVTPFDFHAHLARQAAWSGATFGPGARTLGVCDHIRKELLEIEADPLDLKEWIDVVILALDGAWRCGGTPDQIIDGITAKQAKNEGRAWPDWRTMDPNKAIEHDRSKDVAATVKAVPSEALEHAQQMQGARGIISALSLSLEAFMTAYDEGDAPDSEQEAALQAAATDAYKWLITDVEACMVRDKLLRVAAPLANKTDGGE